MYLDMRHISEDASSLHDIPSFTMQVEYNNVRIQDEFIYGMISNSTSVGGFKGMTGKDVLLDDGVFEVTLIKNHAIRLNSTRLLHHSSIWWMIRI